jgi:hypothetical protein
MRKGYHAIMESVVKKCPLCGLLIQPESELNLCSDCLRNADCCVGLERILD